MAIFFVSAISHTQCAVCPNKAVIYPCLCDNGNIHCGGGEELLLDHIFTHMTTAIPNENERNFKKFTLMNPAIKELKREAFAKITFETIELINATNLDHIDEEAFSGTNI